jgi:HlyD family secretion protein
VNLRSLSGACFAACAIQLVSACSTPEAKTAPATKDEQQIVVSAPGLVEPATEEFKITSEISGKIQTVSVEEGEHVRRGQVIATLESSEYQARIRSAEAEVKEREAELQRLLNGARSEERQLAKFQLEEAQVVFRNSETEMRRREELYQTGDVSKEELDRAERDYKVAAARAEQAKQNQALVNAEPRSDDVSKAQAAINVANGQLLEHRALLDKTIIRSPIDGVVLRKHLKPGESVAAGSNAPIVTLGDTAGLRVRVDVDEADIGKIQVGQRAYVSAQAYGDRKFGGRVVRISQMLGKKNIRTEEPTERIDTKILETLIELDENSKLPPGLRVNTFIITRE